MNILLRHTPWLLLRWSIADSDRQQRLQNAILVRKLQHREGPDEAGSLDREQFYAYTSLKDSLSKDIQDQIATREKYPDVSDIDTKETRRFVENLTFAEGGSTITASITGVELEIPAFWEIVPTSTEESLLISLNRGTEEKVISCNPS
ncbi:MAG: hypothetical protein ACLUGJ_08365 [Blautia wexlerae]